MQDSERQLNPANRELQEALMRLQPAPTAIDRDRLMFRAGQRSVQRRLHVWRGTVVVLAAGFAWSLAVRPGAQQVGREASAPIVRQSPLLRGDEPWADTAPGLAARGEFSENSYARLRRCVLEQGIDALATPSSRPVRTWSSPRQHEEFLDLPVGRWRYTDQL